jgi:hypothetical protein
MRKAAPLSSPPASPLAVPRSPEPVTEQLVCAQPGASYELALVIKRTYRIRPDGRCVLADEQLPIEEGSPNYDADTTGTTVSPPCWDSDVFAFKNATDLVVQGHAHAYGSRTLVDAELRVGALSRTVRVSGDRRCEWSDGRIRFGSPVPFEKMPLRYDRAYGGCDVTALERHGDPVLKLFGATQPEWHLERATRFHYPRNPAGAGYLIEADRESVAALRLPNVEFPFDLVTPERLAMKSSRAWLSAPLPAGFDWFDPGWFPRLAYIAERPEHDAPQGPVAEVAQGWAPPDIVTKERGSPTGWDPRFFQGASPGLSIPGLAFDAEITLRHLFPDAPERRVKLPGRAPQATIEISATQKMSTETRLNAVVVQPDAHRLVLVWSARTMVGRPYAAPHFANMRWTIT